ARSIDGGQSWTVREAPEQMLPRWGGKPGGRLDRPIDFTSPGFAITLRFNHVDTGPTIYWYSLDKGRSWLGPFEFPSLGLKGIAGRTDCVVLGRRDALLFLTAAKSDGKEGRPFCARTRDGGLNWEFVSYIAPEPPGFSIMPSTVALPDRSLLTTVRNREPGAGTFEQRPQRDWIDTYISSNQGKTWKQLPAAVEDTGRGGSPPSLLRLRDGRLCVTYGFRSPPYSIRARLSGDVGRSWGEEILLRRDGKAPDLGYPRSVQRPDGNVVTVYYFNDEVHNERFLEAVIWDPGDPGTRP
ncbi:MAG: sialidase family protein, partial [Bryobacteraceae bacterium]